MVEEVESLERRIRAFSQFAAEPPVLPVPLDLNALLEERVAFLKSGHPEVSYDLRLDAAHPTRAGRSGSGERHPDESAGKRRRSRGRRRAHPGHYRGEERHALVEVHDSGPGLSEQTRQSLFQPSISFKKGGMGLGLSISRKGALLSGGDIVLVKGELGGAAFPRAAARSADPMASKRILIVDDEENIGRSLRLILEREGYGIARVPLHRRISRASRMRSAPTPYCSTCGCRMAAASTCCARCGRTAIPRPVIMISGHGTIADAVEATRAGAFDFLEKPLSRDKVLLAVKNALEQSSLRAENERLRELVGGGREDDRLQPGVSARRGAGHAWRRGRMRACC